MLDNVAKKENIVSSGYSIKFEKTFEHFNECTNLMDLCDEMTEIANSIFIHEKCSIDHRNFNGTLIAGSYTDSYAETADQERLISLVNEVNKNVE